MTGGDSLRRPKPMKQVQAVIDKLLDRKRDASGSILDPNEEATRLKQQLPQTRVIAPGTVSKAE